jgi:hypothetical protein
VVHVLLLLLLLLTLGALAGIQQQSRFSPQVL